MEEARAIDKDIGATSNADLLVEHDAVRSLDEQENRRPRKPPLAPRTGTACAVERHSYVVTQ
jgi:hypothetical protein